MKDHVIVKGSRTGLRLNLDPDCPFQELLSGLKEHFEGNARFWGNLQMTLQLEGRTLTAEEERRVVNTITEHSGIRVLCLLENDPDKMEWSEKTLHRILMERDLYTGAFYRGDLNQGDTLESEKSIVIVGNVREGARVTSKGSIVVLGTLCGTAYAGIGGDREAFIAALHMEPRAVRIGKHGLHRRRIPETAFNAPSIIRLNDCENCTKFNTKNLHK